MPDQIGHRAHAQRWARWLIAFGGLLPALHGQNADFSFDAASLKAANHSIIPGVSGRTKGGPGTSDPGRIVGTQLRLLDLLISAWGVDASRIQAPQWARDSETLFDFTAVMPPRTTREQFQLMIQNLLVEKLKLKFHFESRGYPGYELAVHPSGSKLTPTADPDAPPPPRGPTGKVDGNGFLELAPGHGAGIRMVHGVYAKFQSYTMEELIGSHYLSSFLQQTTGEQGVQIVDRTGLTGRYDFTLKFDSRAADGLAARQTGASSTGLDTGSVADPTGLPNLFKALESQLGLRLIKLKDLRLDTLLIDHAERVPEQ